LLPPLALAEGVVERPWKNPAESKKQQSGGFFNSLFSKKSPTVEQPAPVVGKAPHKKKAKVKKARVKKAKVRKRKRLPVKTARKKRNKEAAWWETVGNPAVFAFRDCSVGHAKLQAANGNTSSPAQVITTAMKTSCQVEFAKMAGVLIGGLGEKRSNAMLTELAKTTFLPTVKAALEAGKEVQAAKVAEVSEDQKLQTAKADMFRCFSERTDRLSVARNIQANTIADAVLVSCRKSSDGFFDLLLVNSKASPQVKLQQKNIALNETYKIAIIRRVLATRKPSQVKTATQQ